ncbi:hypothetical protein [Salidesulfovibrio brasiliensis]|uniref:hypothetical protein n=1 Tax=Salidesulfovibrio brasiliensis TaxID=221711 RepID=UPI0006D06FB0|nr:hypothetical protein [Salidesulfovibrio brasiliensis]
MTRTLALLLALTVMAVSGCRTWYDTKKYMKGSWEEARSWVDIQPTVDTDAYEFENPNQEKLALLFAPVDGPMGSLIRFLEDQDTSPEQEWIELLFLRFPWVNRVIVTDPEGNILTQEPAQPFKRFSQPLVFEGVWRQTFLKTVADYPDLGPELYVGTPYFEDVDFKGLIIAGFDPRSLMRLSPNPDELLIIHPGGGVWTAGGEVDEEGLLAVPWEEILTEDVQGQVKVGEKYYTWIARYIGQDSYIYATESVDPEADGKLWWF